MDKGAHRANGHKGPDHSVDSVVLWPSTSILPDTEAANRVFSSDSYSEAFPLNVMVVGGEAPGRRSGERVRPFNVFIRETPERSLAALTI